MRLLIILILISTTISCKDIAELADKDMPSVIEKVINANQTDSFLIDSIAKFEWDELFILKPYLSESQYEEVEKKVDNMPWMAPYTFSADWHIYFVFAKNGKAIKFSQVLRYPFDFCYVGSVNNPVLIKKGTFLHYKKQEDGRLTIY